MKAGDEGEKWYFTGKPCKYGHLDKRYKNTDICYACKRQLNKNDYLRHRERILRTNRKSNNRSPNFRKSKNNANKKWHQKKRKDPLFRLSRAIARQIWGFMKGRKEGRKWQRMVGYSFEDLKSHLEKKFEKI